MTHFMFTKELINSRNELSRVGSQLCLYATCTTWSNPFTDANSLESRLVALGISVVRDCRCQTRQMQVQRVDKILVEIRWKEIPFLDVHGPGLVNLNGPDSLEFRTHSPWRNVSAISTNEFTKGHPSTVKR